MLSERIAASRLRQYAASGRRESRALPVAALPRLRELLADMADTSLTLTAGFAFDEQGRVCLQADLVGELWLPCQRCLQAVRWPVALAMELIVVEDEPATQTLEDPFDSVLLDAGELPLFSAMEDELLAAVPLAPRHVGEEGCRLPVPMMQSGAQANDTSQRPFADLGALLGRQRDAGGND